MTDLFQDKINWLFQTAGRRVTNVEVMQYIRDTGGSVSAPYLSQLRSGARKNPSLTTMKVIADYFHVDLDFFLSPQHFIRDLPKIIELDESLIGRVDNPRLHILLRCALDLSAESRNILLEMATACRYSEGLPRSDAMEIDQNPR